MDCGHLCLHFLCCLVRKRNQAWMKKHCSRMALSYNLKKKKKAQKSVSFKSNRFSNNVMYNTWMGRMQNISGPVHFFPHWYRSEIRVRSFQDLFSQFKQYSFSIICISYQFVNASTFYLRLNRLFFFLIDLIFNFFFFFTVFDVQKYI